MALSKIDVANMVTGATPVANGGTGLTSGTTNQFLKFTGSTTLASAADNVGKLLQVVQGTLAGVVSTTSGSWSETGLSAAITPSSTSSKILVSVSLISCYQNTANKGAQSTLFRDIGGAGYSNIAPTGTNAFYKYFATSYSAGSGQTQGHNWEILDTVSTTSAVTYKVYFEVDTSSTLNVNQNGTTSYIVLKEIGA